jgi:hypothetical protein
VQLDLFGDYKSNVALYPSFLEYFRTPSMRPLSRDAMPRSGWRRRSGRNANGIGEAAITKFAWHSSLHADL